MESFDQLLNEYVRRSGISDSELARTLGVSRQTIFRWREGLTGRPRQREDVLVIARKLRLSSEERDRLLLAAGFRPEVEAERRGHGDAETIETDEKYKEAEPAADEIANPEIIAAPPPASSQRKRWLFSLAGGLLLVVVLTAVWLVNGEQQDSQTTATPAARAVVPSVTLSPAQPGETIVLITHFANYASSQVGYNVAGRLAQALQKELDQAHQENIRLVIWPQPVGERDEALKVGQTVSATLVIFGEYDVGRIVVEFAQPADQGSFADPALQRHVADVPDLSAAINSDLPQQVRSLALMALGQIFLNRNQADQARPLLLRARDNLKGDPREDKQILALAYFYVGIAEQRSQPPQLDAAIAAYDQAIAAWPEMISSRLNRSAAYVARKQPGDLELALADADQIIAIRPEWAVAYNNRSSIRLTMGGAENLALALADLEKALELDTNVPEIYFNRAYVHFQQGLSMETVAPDLTKALALRPDYANALNFYCRGYAIEQQPELALPYCQQAVAANPQPSFLDSRGLVYALMGDYPAAVDDFNAYTTWLAQQPDEQEQDALARRQEWIKSLEAGQNPFTPTVLAEVRREFGQ